MARIITAIAFYPSVVLWYSSSSIPNESHHPSVAPPTLGVTMRFTPQITVHLIQPHLVETNIQFNLSPSYGVNMNCADLVGNQAISLDETTRGFESSFTSPTHSFNKTIKARTQELICPPSIHHSKIEQLLMLSSHFSLKRRTHLSSRLKWWLSSTSLVYK
ncbi:hypothetical protein QQ045_017517 [Rhodiola kirilowii]